jgi:hypothetical protein
VSTVLNLPVADRTCSLHGSKGALTCQAHKALCILECELITNNSQNLQTKSTRKEPLISFLEINFTSASLVKRAAHTDSTNHARKEQLSSRRGAIPTLTVT